jgi:hypothetical protein
VHVGTLGEICERLGRITFPVTVRDRVHQKQGALGNFEARASPFAYAELLVTVAEEHCHGNTAIVQSIQKTSCYHFVLAHNLDKKQRFPRRTYF